MARINAQRPNDALRDCARYPAHQVYPAWPEPEPDPALPILGPCLDGPAARRRARREALALPLITLLVTLVMAAPSALPNYFNPVRKLSRFNLFNWSLWP
jgi:hypothetical protein